MSGSEVAPGGPCSCALGIDVGGTKIAAGLLGLPGMRVLGRRRLETRAERGGGAVLEDASALASDLDAEARRRGMTVTAVGVALCELVNAQGEPASGATVDWRGLDVRGRFARFGSLRLEADARAAALAEARFGAGKGLHSFLYVTIGTGIGSALVVGGEPHRGFRGCTGTLASTPLPWMPGHPDISLEAFAAGPGLARRYRGGSPREGGQAEDVFRAAASGDREAREILRSGAAAVGGVLGLLVSVLDPEAVILGGGVVEGGGLYLETVVDATRHAIWSECQRGLAIVRSGLGSDAGWMGAAAAAVTEGAADADAAAAQGRGTGQCRFSTGT